MGRWQPLMARDGREFSAYLAAPTGAPRGAVVVLQEIFGVNAHIRALAEQYAAAGFLALAPALYDRIGRNIELGYGPRELELARGYRLQVDEAKALLDIGAAVNVVRHAGRVALVGYCWGGCLAWIGGGALPVQAVVGYYASRLWERLEHLPACPVLLHFGDHDELIPRAQVERVRAAFPQGEYHFYPAGHGFNCDARASYDAPSAALAWERTQAFLKRYLG
jgi:carboxymethylenebutenolidase